MSDFTLLTHNHAVPVVHPEQDSRHADDEAGVGGRLVGDRDYMAAILIAQNLRRRYPFIYTLKKERFVAPGERKVRPEKMWQTIHFRSWNSAVPRTSSETVAAEAGMQYLAVGDLDDSILTARFKTEAVLCRV